MMFYFALHLYASTLDHLEVLSNSTDLEVVAPISFSMQEHTFSLLKTYWADKKWKIAGITYRRTKEIAATERRYNHKQIPIIDANTEFYILSLPGFYSNLPKNLESMEIYFLHKEEPVSTLSLNITTQLPKTIYIKKDMQGYMLEPIHHNNEPDNRHRDSYSCIFLEPIMTEEAIINRLTAGKKDYTRPLKNWVDYYIGRDNRLYYTKMTKHCIQKIVPSLWKKKKPAHVQAIENQPLPADEGGCDIYHYGIQDLSENVLLTIQGFCEQDDQGQLFLAHHLIPFAKRQAQEEIILTINAPIYIQNLVARRPKLKKISYKNGLCLLHIQDECLFIKMNLPIFVAYYLLEHNPNINKITWGLSLGDNSRQVCQDLYNYVTQYPGRTINKERLDKIKVSFS